MEKRIETIEAEIRKLKEQTVNSIIEIGERLIEAKSLLPYGKWCWWLQHNIDMSERTARNFMRVAKCFSDEERKAISGLDVTKLYYLAKIREDERKIFLTVIDANKASTRELEYWVRMWSDSEFELSEAKRITKGLIERGNIEMLSKWYEVLLRKHDDDVQLAKEAHNRAMELSGCAV